MINFANNRAKTHVSTPQKFRVLCEIKLLQFLLTQFIGLAIQVLLDLQYQV